MGNPHLSPGSSSLEDIDVTEELARRPTRPPDHAAENRALVELARQMAEAPHSILQKLADTALELCRADSAGISILETEGGKRIFRWYATAGDFEPYRGGTIPGDFSPCGVVLRRNAPQLMADPVRYYPYIADLSPHVAELLLIPFYRGDIAIGTIWIVARDEAKRFDAEDTRVMTNLSLFTSAAVQAQANLEAIEAGSRSLREAQGRLDSALAAGTTAIWTWDIVNDRIAADANMGRLFSISPEEATEEKLESYARVIHPDDRQRVADLIRQSVESDIEFRAEYRVIRNDGRIRWVDARGKVERDQTGKAIALHGVITDITERKKSEERERLLVSEAALANAKFKAFFDQSLFYSGIMDLDGTLIDISRSALEACGYRREDVIGKPFWETGWWHGSEEVQQQIRFAAAEAAAGRTYRKELPYFLADGTERITDFVMNPVWDESGSTIFLVPTGMDITDRKRAEQDRERLLGQLQEHDKQKNDFLAMLAHELRNPLAAISNAIMLMSLTDVKEHLDYSTQTIQRQAGHLSRLVDGLLDISRINLGKIELCREILDATAILDSAAQTVKILVEERKHTLDMTIDRGNLWVDADPTRLEQVVVNLLNNAAKYSENGGHIRLSAGPEGGNIVIRVKDAGIGIPPEKLPEMFRLFSQADHSSARSEGGLGIGLTIVKSLVEMHGGSITAHSEGPGKGSEFVVRLPAAEQSAATPTTKGPTEAGRTLRILIVDDNVDTVKGLAILLELNGHDVATAHNGPEAIAAAQAHGPDLILLDIGLPGMDGYEVVKRLRQLPCCQDSVIVAASGYGQEEDHHRTKAAGFDHHLVKPIDFDALSSLLAKATRI
jgi:PAS domain S-box-containing protein